MDAFTVTSNRFVYVYYTATQPSLHNRVSRFVANGDVAAAGSELVILDLDPLSGATNHNGGAMHFGPDAKLYIARFDAHYAEVRAFQDEQLRLAKERGYIVTIAGRHWPIGGLTSLDSQLRSYAERLARRATHEGSVADVARRALLRVDRALRSSGLVT